MSTIADFLRAWWILAIPIAFIVVLVYAFSAKRKKQFRDDATIPFEDE